MDIQGQVWVLQVWVEKGEPDASPRDCRSPPRGTVLGVGRGVFAFVFMVISLRVLVLVLDIIAVCLDGVGLVRVGSSPSAVVWFASFGKASGRILISVVGVATVVIGATPAPAGDHGRAARLARVPPCLGQGGAGHRGCGGRA